jgi:hypothetical protein
MGLNMWLDLLVSVSLIYDDLLPCTGDGSVEMLELFAENLKHPSQS